MVCVNTTEIAHLHVPVNRTMVEKHVNRIYYPVPIIHALITALAMRIRHPAKMEPTIANVIRIIMDLTVNSK